MARIASFHQKKMNEHFGRLMDYSTLSDYDPTEENVCVITYVVMSDGYVKHRKDYICGDARTLASFLLSNANDKLVLSGDDYAILAYSGGAILSHKLSDEYLNQLKGYMDEYQE